MEVVFCEPPHTIVVLCKNGDLSVLSAFGKKEKSSVCGGDSHVFVQKFPGEKKA
jgi:hypothetical protein